MSTDLEFQLDLLVRLLLAAVLGAAIGLERERRDHPAGMRTHLLVSVGSATFTVLSMHAFASGADSSRVAAQIVSGIGFLGAGAILKYGATVRGLTTAASLWAVAAVGMAAGAGAWSIAIAATVIVILSLWPLHAVEERFFGDDDARLHVDLHVGGTAQLATLMEELGRRHAHARLLATNRRQGGVHEVEVEIRARDAAAVARILQDLDEIDGVSVASAAPAGD